MEGSSRQVVIHDEVGPPPAAFGFVEFRRQADERSATNEGRHRKILDPFFVAGVFVVDARGADDLRGAPKPAAAKKPRAKKAAKQTAGAE